MKLPALDAFGPCKKRYLRSLLPCFFLTNLLPAALLTTSTDPALSGATVNDFSSYAIGDPLSVSDGVFSLTENGGGPLSVRDTFNGQYGVVGRSVVSFAGPGIRISFNRIVSAFGVHLGAADVGVSWTIEVFNTVGTSIGSRTVNVTLQDRNNGFFIGWADANIGSVILTPSSTDSAIFDHLHYQVASTPAISGTRKPLSQAIQFPADEGSGPVIWYETVRAPNLGSGSSTLTLTMQGSMTEERSDFFGASGDAFGLANGQTEGAVIADSEGTTYLTGAAGSVVLMFQTPTSITSDASIIARRPPTDNPGEPKFEVSLLADGTLRLTTGDSLLGNPFDIGKLAAGTWYYLAVTWELAQPFNQLTWYLGKMGESTMSRGFIDQVTVLGSSNSAITVAGRASSNLFLGSYQNLAIYDRPLAAKAIKGQFLSANALRITHFHLHPEGTPTATLRWTDNLSAAYQIAANDALTFGDGPDLVIPVNSAHGSMDTETFPGEVQFSFTDPGASDSQRFWRVQVDLDASNIFTDPPGNSALLQATIDSLNGVGVLNVTREIVIDAPLTIPSGIELNIPEGGFLKISDPTFLTIEGPISAGPYAIFNGVVTLVEGSVETVTSEWWGTDDLAVNLALLSAGSIPVRVTHDLQVDSAILMNSNQTLSMYGATLFPAAPITGGAVIKNRNLGATNLSILGGTIDGTLEATVGYDAILLTEVNNSLIQDVTCLNVHIRSSLDTGNIHLVDTSYTRIENCDISGTWKMGIKIDFGSHNSIIGGYFFDTHDSGIGAISSPYLVIDGVYVDNCGTSDASNIAVNLQYATIRNSISANGTGTDNGNGITIGHEGWPAIESVCENNLFLNNSAKGIFLQGTATRDIIVRNNIILSNGVGSSGLNSGGIAVYIGIRDSSMVNNEILGNRLGISFMQTSENNLAENNRIKSSTLAGVRSDGINNTLKDNSLANSTNIANGVNEVNLVEINNTETGEQSLDYGYLLNLPLTDRQRAVLTEFLN